MDSVLSSADISAEAVTAGKEEVAEDVLGCPAAATYEVVDSTERLAREETRRVFCLRVVRNDRTTAVRDTRDTTRRTADVTCALHMRFGTHDT